MSELNRAARRRQQKLSRSRRSKVAGLAAGSLAAAGLFATPAHAVAITTTYDIDLSCAPADATADADLLVSSLENAMSDPPAGASAVVNFNVPPATDCVIDLADTDVENNFIALEGRSITINGPTGTGQSLTIMGDHTAVAPVMRFTSAGTDDLAINDLNLTGDPTEIATDALLAITGSAPSVTLVDVTLADQRLGSSGTNAAAIRNDALTPSMSLTNVTVDGNESGDHGAVAIAGEGTITITDSLFQHNRAKAASAKGGAVALFGAAPISGYGVAINNSTFSDNKADGDGAAVWSTYADVSATDSTFHGNETLSGSGGAIATGAAGAGVDTDGSAFTNNISYQDAGAILAQGVVAITDTEFTGNEATNGNSGAMLPAAGGTVSGSTFTNNTAEDDGGAIDTGSAELAITDSEFVGNESTATNGGAVYSNNFLSSIERSTFEDNTAALTGGAVYGVGLVSNSTFVGNTSGGDGGAMALYAEGSVVSSTFWNNISGATGYVIAGPSGTGFGGVFGTIIANSAATQMSTQVDDLGANLLTDIDSTGWTVTAGDGKSKEVALADLDLQPLALNDTDPTNTGTTRTVALGRDSAAIDYYLPVSPDAPGTVVTTFTVPTTDQRGVERPLNAGYEVGSYEYEALAADAPTITSITPGDTTLTVAFTAPVSDGGADITNYEYSTDNGATWTALSPESTTSPFVITGLVNGTTYQVKIRAVNVADSGAASAAVSGKPMAPCSTTTLGNIRFAADSARLSTVSKAKLKVYANQIKDAGCTQIRLNGHTSGKGKSAALDRVRTKLAKARVAAVKRYLDAQLKALGVTVTWSTGVYNANDPLVSNTGSMAYKNRRVEVIMRLGAPS